MMPPNSLFLILFLLPLIQSYNFNGYQIKDLVLTGSNFISEVASWNIPPASISSPQRYYICNGTYILGGFGVTLAGAIFKKTYKNLKPHSMIYFSINFWLIDSWDAGDTFSIKFDNTRLEFWDDITFDDFQPDVCGLAAFSDLPYLQIVGKVPHDQPTLTIQVLSQLDQPSSDESIGFRDVTFHFFDNPVLISAPSYCGNFTLASDLTCDCPMDEYSDGYGGCGGSCRIECQSCFGPTASECFACNDGFWFNGVSCEPCHSSCKTCYGRENGECSTCQDGKLLYLNNTCLDSCYGWFGTSEEDSREYCDGICPGNGFIYPDNTCGGSCDKPYKPSYSGLYKFCALRCPVSEYFLDGQCVSTCPTGRFAYDPWMSCEQCADRFCAKCSGDNGEVCETCKDGAILDNDGICKVCEEMQLEYIQSTDTGPQYRMILSPYTCDLTLSFVRSNLLATGSFGLPSFTLQTSKKTDIGVYIVDIAFKDSVLNPANMDLTLRFLKASTTIPKQFFPSPELLALAGATPTAAAAVTGAFGASFVGTLSIGASAALWGMINYQQFVGYFIFINIEYPFQLELFFRLMQSVGLDFLPNPISGLSEMIDEKFPNFKTDITAERYQPPKKFVKQEITSFFIENGGAAFMMNFCFLGLILVIPGMLRYRQLPLRDFLRKLHFNLKWNINARSFLESGIPIALAVFLQLRKITLDTLYNTASVLFAVFAFVYFMLMIHFLFGVLEAQDYKAVEEKKFKLKYGTLCEGLHVRYTAAKYYNIIILLRGVLLVFLVTFFEDWPLLQTIPLVVYNIGLICYLFMRVDFESRILTVITRTKEIMILMGIISIICLDVEGRTLRYYDMVGWIALGLLVGAFLLELLYTFGVQIVALKQGIVKLRVYLSNMKKVLKKDKKKKRNSKQKIQEKLKSVVKVPRREPKPTIVVRDAADW